MVTKTNNDKLNDEKPTLSVSYNNIDKYDIYDKIKNEESITTFNCLNHNDIENISYLKHLKNYIAEFNQVTKSNVPKKRRKIINIHNSFLPSLSIY